MRGKDIVIVPISKRKISSNLKAILDKVRVTCNRYGLEVNLEQINEMGYFKKSTNEKILEDLTLVVDQEYLQESNNLYSFTDKGRHALPEVYLEKNEYRKASRGRKLHIFESHKLSRKATRAKKHNY